MKITRERVAGQLEREIAAITDLGIKDRVMALLVEPTAMRCAWGYGLAGETYPCWKVAEEKIAGRRGVVGVVYCEQGFGPKCPWGLVCLREPVPAMGQDSGWFSTFLEAAADILDLPIASLNV